MDEPTTEQTQPTGPTRTKLARALTSNVRRSGEKSTVFGRIVTAGLVVVLAGGLAVGIGALTLHHNAKSPKTANAADKQLDQKNPKNAASPPQKAASPPQAGAPVPVPIAPPGKAGPGRPGGGAGKASPEAKKSTKASKGSAQTTDLHRASSVQTTTIVSYASGKCIDVTNEGQTGVPIQIWNCDPVTDWKKWAFYSDGTIRSQGHCMTAGGSGNGTPIEVMSCNGGSAQHFNLNSAHDLVNVAADKCVDVKDQKTDNGTPLQLWSCGGTSNQKWHT
ncbi:MAG: ricin-type beta-trefoil lectin domain protein [Actinoallomurus sp.]